MRSSQPSDGRCLPLSSPPGPSRIPQISNKVSSPCFLKEVENWSRIKNFQIWQAIQGIDRMLLTWLLILTLFKPTKYSKKANRLFRARWAICPHMGTKVRRGLENHFILWEFYRRESNRHRWKFKWCFQFWVQKEDNLGLKLMKMSYMLILAVILVFTDLNKNKIIFKNWNTN